MCKVADAISPRKCSIPMLTKNALKKEKRVPRRRQRQDLFKHKA